MQTGRKQDEAHHISQAADNLKLHEMKKIPYDPRADGFVLTNAAIHTYLARRQRNYEARVAKEVGYDEAKFAKAVGT